MDSLLVALLIENEELRSNWANYIGEVASSHHWSISLVEQKLGRRGLIPSPIREDMDLAYVACALRIIDYAHMNSQRANYIDRLLRTKVDEDSLIHWKAQEYIDGPTRIDNKLKYASNQPIEEVDAWWLFYDMAKGLDKEIAAVSEFLHSRNGSAERFSLEGVHGIQSPKSFASSVRTNEFEPLDIRFKPDSIERLINILGGKTLYGDDSYAPLRELLQNARDAILLRKEFESQREHGGDYKGKITVKIDDTVTPPRLIIKDNGIGMTAQIIENYLLGIASDYWSSEDFYIDFPYIKKEELSPTGKFGIGFLSVFMIGDDVLVETERVGKPRLSLRLNGLKKRGTLISTDSTGNFGTSISIAISKQNLDIYTNLALIIKARTPMLNIPIQVITPLQESLIEPNWWSNLDQEAFFDFIYKWDIFALNKVDEDGEFLNAPIRKVSRYREEIYEYNDINKFDKWPRDQPQIVTPQYRLLGIPDYGQVVLCANGIAINKLQLKGLVGFIEIKNLELTASRNQTIQLSSGDIHKEFISKITPQILEALNHLGNEGMISSRFDFINSVMDSYNPEILLKAKLPWVTTLMPPKDMKLLCNDEFIDIIKSKNEIVISYGINPWDMERICKTHFPAITSQAILASIPEKGNKRLRLRNYRTLPDNNEVSDSLINLFRDDSGEDKGEYKKLYFLISLIRLVSKGWDVQDSDFFASKWTAFSSREIIGYFRKESFVRDKT